MPYSKTQKQTGSAHLLVVLAAVVLIVGMLGYVYWLKISNTNKIVDNPVPILNDTPNVNDVDDEDSKPIYNESSASKNLGTSQCDEYLNLVDADFGLMSEFLGITFSCPSDWSTISSDQYGIILKSIDYQSQDETMNLGITKGSTVWIMSKKTSSTLPANYTNDALLEIALMIDKGGSAASVDGDLSDISGQYMTVDGQRAIKFITKSSQTKNTVNMILFYKDGYEYRISQEYNIDSENPYPGILDEISSSIKFVNQ